MNPILKDSVIGITGVMLTGVTMEQVSAWVSLVCSLAIAVVTCGIQVYRMIRDRDRDREEKEEKEKENNER